MSAESANRSMAAGSRHHTRLVTESTVQYHYYNVSDANTKQTEASVPAVYQRSTEFFDAK